MSHDFSCPTPLILTIFWPSSEEFERPKDLHRFGQVALDSSPLNRRCRPLSYNDRCNVWWRVWFVGCAVPKGLEMWKQYSDFFSMDCYTALQGKCPWLSRNTQMYTANSDEFDDQAEIPSISTSLRSLGVPLASEDPIELPVKIHAVTGAGLIGGEMAPAKRAGISKGWIHLHYSNQFTTPDPYWCGMKQLVPETTPAGKWPQLLVNFLNKIRWYAKPNSRMDQRYLPYASRSEAHTFISCCVL